MALVKYEPWRNFGQLHNDIDRVFSVFEKTPGETNANSWTPAVDITEFKDRYVLAVELPGIAAENVEITLHEGVLEIQGERAEPTSEEEVVYRRSERRAGAFHRRFHLPETIDADNISASSDNGVFEVTIPKQEKAKPRRIEVVA
ncbi:MAG: Hsp20/alpha crystallin family protein [Gammaproteobacteria bacterium]